MTDQTHHQAPPEGAPGAPITVSFRWTLDEYLASLAVNKRAMTYASPGARTRALIPVRPILAAVLLSGWAMIAVYVFRNRQIGVLQGIIAFLMLVAVIIYFYSSQMGRQEKVNRFDERPDKDQPVTYTFTHQGVTTETGGARGTLSWGEFVWVVRTRKGFMLFPNENTYNWVPRHAFSGPEQEAALVELLTNSGVRYQDIK